MTTMRDLLKDFQNETEKLKEEAHLHIPQDYDEYEEAKEALIDEYINTIKERIIG